MTEPHPGPPGGAIPARGPRVLPVSDLLDAAGDIETGVSAPTEPVRAAALAAVPRWVPRWLIRRVLADVVPVVTRYVASVAADRVRALVSGRS